MIIYSDEYLKHNTGIFGRHPESGLRLLRIMEALKAYGVLESSKVGVLKPRMASEGDVLRVHDEELIELVKKLSLSGGGPIFTDTMVGPGSYEVALLAAGGSITAGEAVVKGDARNSFALVRPPGHHAGVHTSKGFCIFNNIAILAKYLIDVYGFKRILIVDWDVHHGNGTQEIFYETSKVLYFSIHQDGRTLYPGTGFIEEIGRGDGEGFTVNIPLPPAANDELYLYAFNELLQPIAEEYKPEMILISAGQDSHHQELQGSQLLAPWGGLSLTMQCYTELAEKVLNLAGKLCGGRLTAILEGGYNLKITPKCVTNIAAAMAGIDLKLKEKPLPTQLSNRRYVESLVKRIKRILSPYWRLQ